MASVLELAFDTAQTLGGTAGGSVVLDLAVGPPGPPGADGADGIGVGYSHDQASPAAIWTVNHNLGTRPAVELRTAGGAVFEADVTHTSANQCVVSLAAALAGSAYCSL